MSTSPKTLKHIVYDIRRSLQTSEQRKYLMMAYGINLSRKHQAQAFGLWKRWMFEHAPQQAEQIKHQLKYLRDYFKEQQVEDYFDLKKYTHPSYFLWQLLLILLGVGMVILGILGIDTGIVQVAYRFNMPSVNSGLYNTFLGLLVLATGISSLRYSLRKIYMHRRFRRFK